MKHWKAICLCACVLTPLLSAVSPSETAPAFVYSDAKDKTFTVTNQYRFTEAAYTPPVLLKARTVEPKLHVNAEDVLASQVGAAAAKNQDWWLRTWDPDTQQRVKDEVPVPSGNSVAFQKWSQTVVNHPVVLTRWVLTGRYLILAYKITGAPGAQDAPERLSVFKLGETGWRATLDLESDPLLLHFTDKVKVIQKVVK